VPIFGRTASIILRSSALALLVLAGSVASASAEQVGLTRATESLAKAEEVSKAAQDELDRAYSHAEDILVEAAMD
jgi:hypothetical protein